MGARETKGMLLNSFTQNQSKNAANAFVSQHGERRRTYYQSRAQKGGQRQVEQYHKVKEACSEAQ
jgi:hypothetical protein